MADPSIGSPVFEIGESSWLTPLGLSDFVAFRVETTGLDPVLDEIIELGAIRFVNGRPEEEFQSFVRTALPLDPFVTDLTGITDADLQTAPFLRDVAPEFLAFLGPSPLVSQNLEFDLAFLRAAGESLAPDALDNPWHFQSAYAIDTALLARTFWPENTGFTLAALADAFGITLSGVHRALDDARTTGELLVALVRLLPTRVWHELANDLHRLIEPTTHRTRPFFGLLRRLATDIKKPDAPPPVPEPDVLAAASDGAVPIEALFGADGLFEQRLPFFRTRPMQLDLARAAEEAFKHNQILLAEAPTGVGKSLAYLTAALRWIQADPEAMRQVVVSSHTKVLQDQLCRKDIAELRQAVGGDFRAAVLKGRANYLCRRRLRLVLREAGNRLSDSDRLHLLPLLRWSELTATGDIAEIPAFHARHLPFLWSQVASDPQACAGGGCTAAKGDFYRLAQERAARAHIIFVNHALLLADLARFAAGPARKLVLDEAHQIERAMVGAMSVEISAPLLRTILIRLVDERGTRGLLPTVVKRLAHGSPGAELLRGRDLIAQARNLHASVRQYFSALAERLQAMLDSNERSSKLRFRNGQQLHAQIGSVLGPFLLQWNELAAFLRRFHQDLTDLRGESKLAPDLLIELKSAVDAIDQSAEALYSLLRETDANTVTWVEFGRSSQHTGWCALYAAPISVGTIMEKAFWPVIESAVLTSATLTIGGQFRVLRNTLGLESQPADRLRELELDSPFRLDRQMRSLVPVFLPEPRQGGAAYAEVLTDMITRLIERFDRGTLVLCTSNELVDRLTTALAPIARRAGRRLLSQGNSASLAELVAEFRRRGNAILIGAASFWEGIDVVGDALQILVVTRIPFDVPTDPWVAARTESLQDVGRDPFLEYSLPVAALRLKQGVGRLIRHNDDRGVAILADPRLFKTRYGRLIRESLPSEAHAVHSEDELFRETERFFGNHVSW